MTNNASTIAITAMPIGRAINALFLERGNRPLLRGGKDDGNCALLG
ncbi:MAG: hypothetical protein NVS2B12_20580 [Ktedonobacteraceae bacterium]